MNAREKVSLKNGDIKVFLTPQEVALIASCLAWVQADLMRAALDCEGMVEDSRKAFPKELLTYLIPVIKSTISSILLHGTSHYEEKHDGRGRKLLVEAVAEMNEETTRVQSTVRLIAAEKIAESIQGNN